jgi:hypothetical protein
MLSVVDRNVVMRRIPVFWDRLLLSLPAMLLHQRVVFNYIPKQVIYIYAFADDDYVPFFRDMTALQFRPTLSHISLLSS